MPNSMQHGSVFAAREGACVRYAKYQIIPETGADQLSYLVESATAIPRTNRDA